MATKEININEKKTRETNNDNFNENEVKPILGNKIKDFTKNKNGNIFNLTITQTQIETPESNTLNLNEKKEKLREGIIGDIKNSSITIPKLNFHKIKLEQEKNKLHKYHSINFEGKLYFEDNNINLNNSNENKKKKKKRHHKHHKSHKIMENLKIGINEFSDFEINQELKTNYFIE